MDPPKESTVELFHAILSGSIPGMQAAVERGATLNDRAPPAIAQFMASHDAALEPPHMQNLTTTMVAAYSRHEHVLKYLLDNGARATDVSETGGTTLGWCAWFGDVGISRLVVQAGVDVHARNTYGATVLHGGAGRGIVRFIKFLVEECGADPRMADDNGSEPIHWAAEKGHIDALAWFHEEAGVPLDVTDGVGDGLLQFAAFNCHLGALQWLINRGLPIRAVNAQLSTLLHLACCKPEGTDVALWLLSQGLDANAATITKETVGHFAASSSTVAVMEALIAHSCDVTAASNDGTTPLHSAAAAGRPVAMLQLLLDHGADLAAVDRDGFTPLHVAAETSHPETCWFLASRGAAWDATSMGGHTPLAVAVGEGSANCALTLMAFASPPFEVPRSAHGMWPVFLEAAFAARKRLRQWFDGRRYCGLSDPQSDLTLLSAQSAVDHLRTAVAEDRLEVIRIMAHAWTEQPALPAVPAVCRALSLRRFCRVRGGDGDRALEVVEPFAHEIVGFM